jgi:hypothetical protein
LEDKRTCHGEAGRAQQSALPVIGFLGPQTLAAQSLCTAAFVQRRLRELGWIEGRTVAIEYRRSDARLACSDHHELESLTPSISLGVDAVL